jgi:hypothetical protein
VQAQLGAVRCPLVSPPCDAQAVDLTRHAKVRVFLQLSIGGAAPCRVQLGATKPAVLPLMAGLAFAAPKLDQVCLCYCAPFVSGGHGAHTERVLLF